MLEFVTLQENNTDVGWTAPEDNSDIVERDGYIPTEQRVKEFFAAGKNLEAHKKAAYPEGTTSVPIFMDKLQAADYAAAVNKRYQAYLIDEQNRQELFVKAERQKEAERIKQLEIDSKLLAEMRLKADAQRQAGSTAL